MTRPPIHVGLRAATRLRIGGVHSPAAWTIGLCLVLLILGGPAVAQEEVEDDPFAGVEEMVVVGGNAAALLLPTSTSAVAFDTADLEAYGVDDIGDIAAFVPNLDIRSQNATNASFFIRGIGLQDFGANASSAVPILQDGIVRNPSAVQLVGLFDVGGLTVLRGPQGSGNFRNASAGAIRVDTAKPQSEFSGFAQVSAARLVSVDAIDANRYNFEAAVTSGVYEDIVSIRLSARYSHENPFVENGCANRIPFSARNVAAFNNDANAQICASIFRSDVFGRVSGVDGEGISPGFVSRVLPFIDKKVGEVDDYGFRAQIRIQPPDTSLDLIFRAEISNLNRDSTLGAHIGTSGGSLGSGDSGGYRDPEISLRFDELQAMGLSLDETRNVIAREIFRRPGDSKPYSGNFDSPGRTLVETTTISMTASMEFDQFDMDLNAGFIDYRKSEGRDTDLSPNVLFPSEGDDQAWEVYADLSFSGDTVGDAPIAWAVGGYTLIEQVEARQDQFLANGGRTSEFEQEIYSFGAFLEAEYEFLEAFTLSAGARYNWERKDFEVLDRLVTGPNPLFSSNQLTWDAVTGFAEIRYEFTEEIGTYLKYTRGFKAGHFNPSRPQDAKIPGSGFADPEQIDSIEWGLDFGGWSGRFFGNAALFYYNYKNYQVFRLTQAPTGVFREIQNARSARNLGAELEITIRPLEGYVPEAIEGLSINFRGGWLDTEFLEFTNVEARQFPGFQLGVTVDNTGNPLISAAQLSANLSVTWPLVADRLGMLTPQYDLAWTDDTPFGPNRGRGQTDNFGRARFPPYQIGNRAYAIHNVRLSYEPPGEGGIRISGWCRNVTDERFNNFAVDLSSFVQLQLHYPADPRICGADLRLSW